MNEPDELYTLRNNFWLGNFQRAVAEGSSLSRLSDALKIECAEFIFRSYIAMGQYNIVIEEVSDDADTPVALQAIKLLARYLSHTVDSETIVGTLESWLFDAHAANSTTLQLVACTIYMHEGRIKEALRSIRHSTTMEQLALNTQILIKMQRVDLAAKQVKLMQQADEDATLTQLATAWLHMASGGSKYQEAAYVFEELIDKFGPTTMLLNGAAAANLHMGQYEEAERFLLQAITQGPNDPDTLVNLISCYHHMAKSPDLIQRYTNQLKSSSPSHPYVKSLATIEGAFDRVAAAYASQIA